MTFRSLLAKWLTPKPDNAVPDDEREARRVHFDPATERHLTECAENARQAARLAARKLTRPDRQEAALRGVQTKRGRA